jgi:glutamine synthetase
MATDLAAGLDGIEQGMTPTEPTLGNAYEDFHGEAIPTDLGTALELARGSDWMKDVMGETMWELYCQMAEREQGFFQEQVTPVETDRYLRTL